MAVDEGSVLAIGRVDHAIVEIRRWLVSPVGGEADCLATGTKHSKGEDKHDDLGSAIEPGAEDVVKAEEPVGLVASQDVLR